MIRLWISEGFVQQPNTGKKSLKQEAESYLNDLIDRSLVMIARKCSTGGVKACHVHDVLREFCSAELEKRRCVIRENVSGGIAVLYGGFERHKLNLLRIFLSTKVQHICSLLYFRKLVIDMNYVGREYPFELESSALVRCSRNYLSEQDFRNLLSVNRYNLSENVMFRNRLVVLGTRTSLRRRLNYGSFLKYKNLKECWTWEMFQ
ncbi:hypothetical protein ACH5RR_026724 [Cinchona calisaya]|uniref:Disease resistance protein winged helix domain-containing protein n=1 Tax=Cinchona calisaya TaxID=153742 RepID=A0ABD2Z7B7_9GENT